VTAREWEVDVRMNLEISSYPVAFVLRDARATPQEKCVMILQFPNPIEQGL
jgi:hypothetical protein